MLALYNMLFFICIPFLTLLLFLKCRRLLAGSIATAYTYCVTICYVVQDAPFACHKV